MSYNYDDYKPINPQPPRKRKNIAIIFIKYAILTLLIFALAISAVFFVSTHKKEKDNLPVDQQKPSLETQEKEETEAKEEEETEEVVPEEPKKDTVNLELYENIDVPKSNINKGGLIYVSGNYKVVYPTADELVSLVNVKAKSYLLSTNTMKVHKDIVDPLNKLFDDFAEATKHKDIILWTTYRDEARQKQVYDEFVKKNGEEAAKNAVAKAGESDHNTGLGVAIRVFRNKQSYQLSEVEGYEWILENCHKYGFVERYPSNKIEQTGFDYSTSLYLRYVGVPHAEYMKNNDLCLEEYLTKIKGYEFGTEHLNVKSHDGKEYEIYYVNGSVEGDVVSVSVPKDKEYTISGNNIDGFIVSALK